MKHNQKGFGLMGILLIIVVVGVLAGLGWYAVQRKSNSNEITNATYEQPAPTKTYTDSSKLYSLKYPEGWSVNEAADCCEGAPKDYTQTSRSVTFVPPAKADIHGYGVQVQADGTDALATLIRQRWQDNKHTPESKTVHGYSTQYVRVEFNGDAERYIDHDYLITHNNASVYLTYREKYYHQYPAADWSAAGDLVAFKRMLNSIEFLK
jgi:hypothetical protein